LILIAPPRHKLLEVADGDAPTTGEPERTKLASLDEAVGERPPDAESSGGLSNGDQQFIAHGTTSATVAARIDPEQRIEVVYMKEPLQALAELRRRRPGASK
jgi:hypothetical protein